MTGSILVVVLPLVLLFIVSGFGMWWGEYRRAGRWEKEKPEKSGSSDRYAWRSVAWAVGFVVLLLASGAVGGGGPVAVGIFVLLVFAFAPPETSVHGGATFLVVGGMSLVMFGVFVVLPAVIAWRILFES